MTRLSATAQHDFRLQWRNGFYYAAAVMLALFALLLAQLSRGELRWLLPVVVVNNIVVNGFYFVAGLVLLEKAEGSLQAQVITPLRPREYLVAKLLSLTLLSLVENGLLALLLFGPRLSAGWLLLAVAGGTSFFALAGFLLVVRFEAINEFLLPSLLAATLLTLPLLSYFGIGDEWALSALLYAHPLQPVLLALQASLGAPLTPLQTAYILLYLPLILVVALQRAERAYQRFVREGASAARSRS